MNNRTLTILVHFIFGPVLIHMSRGIDLVRLRDTSLIVLIFASNLFHLYSLVTCSVLFECLILLAPM